MSSHQANLQTRMADVDASDVRAFQEFLAEVGDSLGSVDQETKDLEKAYRTGEAKFYRRGIESFRIFCKDHSSSLSEIDTAFPVMHPSKRHLELQICDSATQDFDIYEVGKEKRYVEIPTNEEGAPLVHLVADYVQAQTPFRVRGYVGEKVVDMELVVTKGGFVETLSPLLNCTLALSRKCICGVSRPGEPDVDPEQHIAVAFFFRLSCIVSKLLPCGCGQDCRLSTDEEVDNWYAALVTIAHFLEYFYRTLPMIATEGHMHGEYEGVTIAFKENGLACTFDNSVSCSSFRTAADLVASTGNAYIAAENEDLSASEEEKVVEAICDRMEVAKYAAEVAQNEGTTAAVNFLCYNKLSINGAEKLSISPFNAELRRTLQYMDSENLTSLCGIPLCDLEKVRIPVLNESIAAVQAIRHYGGSAVRAVIPVLSESIATVQALRHYGGSAVRVAMIYKEVVLKKLSVRCRPRARLEYIRNFSEREIVHSFQGRSRTIAITPQGTVIAFRRRSRLVKSLLRSAKSISVLGNGIGFDLTELVSIDFGGDTDLVNRALKWEYGPDVFHFVLYHVFIGNIHVQKDSPAASFVPASAKHGVGVRLFTLLDNRFFRDQTFVLSRGAQSKNLELYWLPDEGMNYFKVVRNPDGLYSMKELTTTEGPLVYKCSAIFPAPIT